MRSAIAGILLVCLSACSSLPDTPDPIDVVYTLNNTLRVVTREVHKACVDKVVTLDKCRELATKINLAQSDLRMATELVSMCGDCAEPHYHDVASVLTDIEKYLRSSP